MRYRDILHYGKSKSEPKINWLGDQLLAEIWTDNTYKLIAYHSFKSHFKKSIFQQKFVLVVLPKISRAIRKFLEKREVHCSEEWVCDGIGLFCKSSVQEWPRNNFLHFQKTFLLGSTAKSGHQTSWRVTFPLYGAQLIEIWIDYYYGRMIIMELELNRGREGEATTWYSFRGRFMKCENSIESREEVRSKLR